MRDYSSRSTHSDYVPEIRDHSGYVAAAGKTNVHIPHDAYIQLSCPDLHALRLRRTLGALRPSLWLSRLWVCSAADVAKHPRIFLEPAGAAPAHGNKVGEDGSDAAAILCWKERAKLVFRKTTAKEKYS